MILLPEAGVELAGVVAVLVVSTSGWGVLKVAAVGALEVATVGLLVEVCARLASLGPGKGKVIQHALPEEAGTSSVK